LLFLRRVANLPKVPEPAKLAVLQGVSHNPLGVMRYRIGLNTYQGGSLRSAAPGRACAGLRPWGADPAAHREASRHLQIESAIDDTHRRSGGGAIFLGFKCPSRGQRVKGAYGVACDRSATPNPLAAHKGFGAPMSKMAKRSRQGVGRHTTRRAA
jgi:hypothetical protein